MMFDHFAPILQFMSFGKSKMCFDIHSLSCLLHLLNFPSLLKVFFFSVRCSGVAWKLALSRPQTKNGTAGEQAGERDTNPYDEDLCILIFRPLISADKAVHFL